MRRLFLKLFRRRTLHRDMEAELAFHREMAAAQGNPIGLGNTALVREQALDLWRFTTAENLWRDMRYAVRGLARSPGLVLSALLSLGLGIGVNTAIFSLAVEFLLSEPSVRDASSLVSVRVGHSSHAKPETLEFLRRTGTFADIAGEHEEVHINWSDGSETRRLFAVAASKNYFAALGVPVLHGRGWSESDPNEVVVVSYRFWHRYLNEDPSVVGRAMNLNGRAYTIVGVLPENHRTLIGFGLSPDVYVPRFLPDTILSMYARLKPGMTPEQGLAALRLTAQRMDEAMPQREKFAQGIRVRPIAGLARLLKESQMASVALFFLILLVVAGLVLLIACANVASLLLARAASRQREIAVRLSLGASRGRIVQQLLMESVLLSALGAALGVLLAQLAARAAAAVPLPLPVPIRIHVELDWRVMLYATVLLLAATLACGLLPAWQSISKSLTTRLVREPRLRLRRTLVAVQIGVSVVVLATGFLFVRNLLRSSSLSPGFDVRNTVRAEVHLPTDAYASPAQKKLYLEQALTEMQTLPGIEAAAAARVVPFTDSIRHHNDMRLNDNGDTQRVEFHWNAVSPEYFRVMQIPVIAGSTFERSRGRAVRQIIVNETFARMYLPSGKAVGVTFKWQEGSDIHQIVGVVGGTKNITIGEEPRAQLYQALDEVPNDRTRVQFVMRSSIPPASQIAAVRAALRRIEPRAAAEVSTLYASIGLAFLPSQVGAALLGSIGLLALLLAAVGLSGVCAYSVTQRTREIGLRMAIGATRAQISRLIVVDALKPIVYGSAAGVLIALFVTKPLAMFFVHGLSPADPVSYLAVLATLAAVGLLATLGPLRRALRVDPVSSLRYE